MSQELDEACAVAMGWVKRYSPDPTIYAWEKPNGERVTAANLPWFSSQPIAAGWLEDEIERRNLIILYLAALREITRDGDVMDWWQDWVFLRATPVQRAQAFLMAINSEV